MKKVVIGLSGGVDSSVAAYLLKEQGYEVIALFMRNWHDTTGTLDGDCPWEDDRMFAELVAKKLDIPFHYIDLSEQYRARVVDYMFSEYEKGRTPNPDVLCNREIKFDAFLKAAIELGGDYVATGHYCQREVIEGENSEEYKLIAGADPSKDQSYFLCQLSQEQLSKALFPIGGILKSEVRRIASEQGLATAQRKDSQGICFVGKVDLPIFLQQKLKAKKGEIIEISDSWEGYNCEKTTLLTLAEPYTYKKEDGVKVGEHNGAHFYTIGQRKGLNVGGKPKPLFVLAINVEENVVYVGQGDTHPGLLRKALFIKKEEIHYVRPSMAINIGSSKDFKMRIRYRQPLQDGTLIIEENGAYIVFKEPQKSITAGQFAAWYSEDGELEGSGVINS
ncbi:MAG: tRNA 2-thiouridine(34) synthase MnmA [Rikenellaceae bacterium]